MRSGEGNGTDEWQHISIRVMIQRQGEMENMGRRKPDSTFDWSVEREMLYKKKARNEEQWRVSHSFHIPIGGPQWVRGKGGGRVRMGLRPWASTTEPVSSTGRVRMHALGRPHIKSQK